MFSFLNTGILFAAAAALIPLIIHLFSKRRVRIIEFSSLKHLKAMQRRQVKRLRIRQLLLLLLRMLIIFVVVLAFARPTTSGGSIGSHASVSAVMLFDNSASMNRYVRDGRLFDLAKSRTLELMTSFGEGDEVILMTIGGNSGNDDELTFASAALAKEKTELMTPGFGPTTLAEGLDGAVELLAQAKNLNKEIYIISDQQRNALPEQSIAIDTGINVYFVELPIEASDNLGITEVDLGGKLLIPGQPFDLTATIKNYGNQSYGDVIASLFFNGVRVSQTSVEAAAEKEATVRFTHSLSRGGFHSGHIELSDDKFAADNDFYFSFQIPEQFNVLIIDGDDASDLIRLALVPSQAAGQYWSAKQAHPDNLLGVNFRNYDVIILAGAPKLPPAIVNRLKNQVKVGRSLFITYGADTDPNYFNSTWSELTGLTIEERMKSDFTRAGFYSIGYLKLDHPIFSIFEFDKTNLPELRFFALPKVSTAGNAAVLMRFTGDRPALVENNYFAGKILTFAGPMAPAYTDLTGHAFFVPFIARISEYLASRMSGLDLGLHTDTKIVRNLILKGALDEAIELVAPDTQIFYIPTQEGKGNVTYNAVPANVPGIYRAFFDRQEVDRFAVNINPFECNLTSSSFDRIAVALGADNYHVLKTEQPLQATIAELRFGKELWQMFLWIAAILILIELLISRSSPAEGQE